MATSEELKADGRSDGSGGRTAACRVGGCFPAAAAGKLTGPGSGQSGKHPGRLVQSSQRDWTICAIFPSRRQRKRHQRSRKWRRRVERRRRRRTRLAKEKKQVSRMHTIGAPAKAKEFLSELVGAPKCMIQRKETTTEPIAVSGSDSGSVGKDHLLLILRAVINDTRVSALVDSGATRSFVSEQLQTRPPMKFIGAYSSLELANGETIVSTGIAPNVLVCIGSTVSRVSLTAVPLMEGIEVILGRDWLDAVNPLVDWRTNSLVLRNGDKLEVVQGIKTPKKQSCKIVDRGLTGLQHTFHSLKESVADPDFKWGHQYAQLCSPSFWEPQPSVT